MKGARIMEIRPIRPDEKTAFDKIQSVAFMFKRDFSKVDAAAGDEGCKTGRAAFDENGKMCSCFDLIPYSVRFDGSTVPMGGIGGVASLPEERDKKFIRHIFEYAMNEMYEKGYVFSYLYPFSHAYYRKFGYELNMTSINHMVPVTSFRHFVQTGRLKMLADDADRQVVRTVYEEYIRDKNLAVVRTDEHWKKRFDNDPYKDNIYLYIWYNDRDEARGYIQYHIEKSGEVKSNIVVRELIWLDPEALKGIFAFVSKLSAQIGKMIWKAPSFIDLLTLFPEPYDVSQEIYKSGMNRIVNVQKAFELMSLPDGKGELVISAEDQFFPTNTGSYRISWDNGSRLVERCQAEPDLNCDIQALSQLLTGFASVEALSLAGTISVNKKRDLLCSVFRQKRLFINDYF
jgi:predicted acetyltransferase